MRKDKEEIKLIKETIFKAMMLETESRLNVKIPDNKECTKIVRFTQSKLREIMNSFDENDFLPKGQITSQQDFERHILEMIQMVKNTLLQEIQKDFS